MQRRVSGDIVFHNRRRFVQFSFARFKPAITIAVRPTKGEAVLGSTTNASNGMATRALPNPVSPRTKVARKTMPTT